MRHLASKAAGCSSSHRERILRGLAPLTLALVALVASPAAGHDEPPSLRRIDFQVERSREVDNDEITAVLRVELEDAEPARLADRVNRAMSAALARARLGETIAVQTGGYRTGPIRQKQQITGWRASQDLILRSTDLAQLSARIGELQGDLQLASIAYAISERRQAEVVDELIAQALKAFRARAELIRTQLEADRYQIVHLGVSSGGPSLPRPQYARAEASLASVAPPALEGGTSRVVVAVSATIQLD